MQPRYSICMTNYNSRSTLEASLQSLLSQIDASFEVVVVDNMSTDGSREMLERYAKEGSLKLVVEKCSRGRGRQIAFERSTGEYIISNIDFDDQILPKLKSVLTKYSQSCGTDLLRIDSVDSRNFWGGESFGVAPRALLTSLGGWRNLQLGEDWELWRRASAAGKYKWTYYQLLATTNAHRERKTLFGTMKFRFVRYRDLMRCGRQAFKRGEDLGLSQRIPYWMAAFFYRFYEQYDGTSHHAFDPEDPEQFVDFGEGMPIPKKGEDEDSGISPVSGHSLSNL